MTAQEFKERAQEIYDNCKGSAGEEGHIDMDILMEEALISLGFQEGVEILRSMKDIWYA